MKKHTTKELSYIVAKQLRAKKGDVYKIVRAFLKLSADEYVQHNEIRLDYLGWLTVKRIKGGKYKVSRVGKEYELPERDAPNFMLSQTLRRKIKNEWNQNIKRIERDI